MKEADYLETLNRLESSLFKELFLNNPEKANSILKKQESILKFSKVSDWLLSDIKTLDIPKKIAEKLLDKGIEKIIDIVYLLPLRVEEYTFKDLKSIKDGDFAAVKGIVTSKNRGHRVYTIILNSNGNHLRCNWFNITPYIKKMLNSIKIGDEIVCYGKFNTDGLIKQINHPKVKKPEEFQEFKRVVYPALANLRNTTITKIIDSAFECAPKVPFEWLPYFAIYKNQLPIFSNFLKAIHKEPLKESQNKRLKYEELFLLILALKLQEKNLKLQTAPKIKTEDGFLDEVQGILPFELTKDQKDAIREILSDMAKDKPMLRLLQGDVGCGKTIVSLIAALAAVKASYQVAIMTPTQPLAIQFFQQAKQLFDRFGFSTELLITSTKNKNRIYEGLKNGSINLVIGTHALLQEAVEFKNLGFIVIDEQHRFGVEQRKTLSEKGKFPHVLIMSATPIPRSLSMVLYSKSSLTTIKQKPKNRGKIYTLHFTKGNAKKAYEIALSEIEKGHQAYIIAPLIDESEHFEDIQAAVNLYEKLKSSYFKNVSIELLHGKLKSDEKERIINDFREGKISCLVSTTVVEVGIDSPKATVIIIENAERFGLAQLHQLRGRVGRSELDSYCILLTDKNISETAKKRISALLKTNDGFKIAEMDFAIRGSGEILGTRQHGKDLVFTDLIKDKNLITTVKNDVEALLEKGYPLNKGLLKIMQYRWKKRLSYINVG